ncbi:MAG: hypothetical protein AB8G26_09790 [Ilumatobacter sp.]
MRGLAINIGVATVVACAIALFGVATDSAPSAQTSAVIVDPLVPVHDHGGRKPHARLGVEVGATELNNGLIDVGIDAEPGTVGLRLLVSSAPADGAAERVLFDAPVEAGDRIAIDAVDVSGRASIVASLVGVAADGAAMSATDRIWFDVSSETLVLSEIGPEDLAFRLALADVGDDSAARPTIGTDRLVLADGPPIAVDDTEVCAPDEVCAHGIAEWTDRVGRVHPIVSAYVDLVEVTPDGREIVRTTVITDADGRFRSAAATTERADIFVRLRAAGPGFEFVVERAGGYEVRTTSSQMLLDVAPGTSVETSFLAGNVDAHDTVFSLHAAMTNGVGHVETLRARPIGDVDIVFPAAGTFYDPNTERVHMLELDRWDWDVMLHEYGHFVADVIDIEANPGGRHSGSENLGDRLDKDTANRLAWGEGWPTYFAVSALLERGAGELDLDGVGDTAYQDTEDTFIVDDLEDAARLGEDNELSVASILWDLYDDAPDDRDRVALGTQQVWDTLDAGEPRTLSDAIALFAPDRGARSDAVNCVVSQMNVAPSIIGPAVRPITSGSPTLGWERGNGGRRGANDRFIVEYRDAETSVLLHAATTSSVEYRAAAADWSQVVGASGGTVAVSVVGTSGRRSPVTGPYRSCASTFTGGPSSPPAGLFDVRTPRRLLDTRPGELTADGRSAGIGKTAAGAVLRVQVAGRGSVPVDARGAIVNLTAVASQAEGFVVAFDCSTPMPLASSLNYAAGTDVANELVVALSRAGELCLFSSADVHLLLDVVGHILPSSPLVTVTPARLLETRAVSTGTVDGRSAGVGRIRAGTDRRVQVTGRAGVPDDAVAAIVNVAAVQPESAGYVTVSPCTDDPPLAASLNVVAGIDRADEIVAPLDGGGGLCVYSSESTDVIVDVVGFVPAGTDYVATVPARFHDTRSGAGSIDGFGVGTGRVRDGQVRRIQITGRGGVPGDAVAVAAYVTSIAPDSPGFFTVWPCVDEPPLASSVNHVVGGDAGSELLAPLDERGGLCIFTRGGAHLTVDVSGYLRG